MQVSQRVHVIRTAEEVWDIVGRRFGEVATWASAVASSRPIDGAGPGRAPCPGRACTVAVSGFGELTEELTAYDDRARTLTCRATSGMPGFVREARNTWTVEEGSADSSVFAMRAEVELSPLGRARGPGPAPVPRPDRPPHLPRPQDLRRDRATAPLPGRPRGAGPSASGRSQRPFSGFCGLLLMTGADTYARPLGSDSSIPISLLGLALLGYGLGLVLLLLRGVAAATGRVLAGLDAAGSRPPLPCLLWWAIGSRPKA